MDDDRTVWERAPAPNPLIERPSPPIDPHRTHPADEPAWDATIVEPTTRGTWRAAVIDPHPAPHGSEPDWPDMRDAHPSAVLMGAIVLGTLTRIYPLAVIGSDAEHRSAPSVGRVIIGARCVIREHVAIQRGTGDRETTIGDDVLLMHGSHVAHDCVIGDGVTVSPNAVLGGHVRVHRGVTIGMGAVVHQCVTIGAYAMIGMGAVVTRDVPPFAVAVGNPARFRDWNDRGFVAAGFAPEDYDGGTIARENLVTWDGRTEAYRVAFAADSGRRR